MLEACYEVKEEEEFSNLPEKDNEKTVIQENYYKSDLKTQFNTNRKCLKIFFIIFILSC